MDYDPGLLPCPIVSRTYEVFPHWGLILLVTVALIVVVWRLISRGVTFPRFGLAALTFIAGSVAVYVPRYVLERLRMQADFLEIDKSSVVAVYGGAFTLFAIGFVIYLVLDRICEHFDTGETPASEPQSLSDATGQPH